MQTKVLTITSVGFVAGGAETIIVKTSPYLLKKGYSLKILAGDVGANKERFNDYTFKSFNSSSPFKMLFFLFNPYSYFALRKVLKEYKPDIIHIHIMDQISPSVLFLLKKYPTVMTLHGPESFLKKLLLWYLSPSCYKHNPYDKNNLKLAGKLTYFYFYYVQKFIYKFGLKNVNIFIAPSKYIQNLVKTDVSPTIHLPNFVELRKFHELTNTYNLLFVGRLEKVKGVEFLIQAMSFIINVFPQTTLTIVGDGSNMADLLNLTKRLQIEKYVQFVGWVENNDLDTYYEKASIVVAPSIWVEAFGIVILEAMSVGRPVIGTNVGGIPEIISDGVNGYIVEPKNSEQIAEKVIKLFSEEKLLKELVRNARLKAEGFSVEKYVEKLEEIYGLLLKEYR